MSVAAATLPPVTRPTLLDRVAGTDHKRIGLATTTTAIGFFLAGGILALLMRTELAAPGMQLVSTDTYNQLYTIHGSTMFFLFATPAAIGIGLYMVPLQIGARGLRWPRLALFGFWIFALGGAIMYSGFLVTAGAATFGWTAYYPLSDLHGSPSAGVDLWLIAVVLATSGVVMQAASLLATVISRRTPEMTLLRMPLFTWSEVVTSFMILAALPVVVATMALLYVDRHLTPIFSGSEGPITYQHLFWFYGHPVVYIVFFPLVGAVGEVIATFSRRRFFGFRITVISLLVFSAFSMSVWGHHMFTTGSVASEYFSLTSTALLVPAGIEYLAFLGTMAGGRIHLGTPMLFALGFVLLFLIGGLTGIFVASPPLDYHAHDSYFVVAHFHYTLFGGTVFGLFAAIYYWFPKVTGRLLGERLGRLHAGLMFAGALVTFIPMFMLGSDGMARRIADYLPVEGWTTLNAIATVGAFMIFASIAVFLVNLARSLRRGRPAGWDPWQGQTLEWAADSPPARENFDRLPPIRSFAPLLDIREAAGGTTRPVHGATPRGDTPTSRPSLPALPIVLWGLLLALLTGVGIIFFDIDAVSPALLGGAAAAVLATGAAVAALGPGPDPELVAEPDTSAATVWLAVSVALLGLSAAAGPWLTLIAAGMAGVGVGGLIRELVAQRRALREGDRGGW